MMDTVRVRMPRGQVGWPLQCRWPGGSEGIQTGEDCTGKIAEIKV